VDMQGSFVVDLLEGGIEVSDRVCPVAHKTSYLPKRHLFLPKKRSTKEASLLAERYMSTQVTSVFAKRSVCVVDVYISVAEM